MPEYQNLTDDEVLQIATESEQLTDDARTVLDSELARRKLSAKDVQSQKVTYERAQKLEHVRTQQRIINRSSYDRSGIGFGFLGRWNLRRDPSGQSEEYDTTRWFVVFWVPVFPIATFTVRRTILRRMGIRFRSDPQILARHPRTWNQILLTWVKTAAVVMVIWFSVLFIEHHPELLRRLLGSDT